MSQSRSHSAASSSPIPLSSIKPLLAFGLLFSLVGLAFDVKGIKTLLSDPVAFAQSSETTQAIKHLKRDCVTEVVSEAQLSRKQLLEILAVPERDNKTRIRQIATEPYCQLSSINIRAGVEATREAYPLAFDPNTTLVILYENDEYAGYRFKH